MINKTNNNKILLLIIALLLIANIALLAFLFFDKEDHHEGKRPDRRTMISNFLKTEIGFNAVQLQQYDSISLKHKENMKAVFEQLKNGKGEQFKELVAGNFKDSVMMGIAEKSAAAQKQMELNMFSHLRKVRSICTEDQLAKFDSLFVKMLKRNKDDGKRMGAKEKAH